MAAAIFLAAALAAGNALAADADLDALMARLAGVQSADERFTEHRHVAILTEPLVTKGRVVYRAPDYVKKEYDDPDSESYVVSGDALVIWQPDGLRRELSIDEHPVLRAFVTSYRGTLAGDLESLRRFFDVELSGTMSDWKLRLTPRDPEPRSLLSLVVVHGRDARILRIDTIEPGGDRSAMIIDEPGS